MMKFTCLSYSFILVFAVSGHQNTTWASAIIEHPENDSVDNVADNHVRARDDTLLMLQNNEKIPNDADLQVALMPQELNTAFIPNKNGFILPKEIQGLMPQELNPVFTPPDGNIEKNAVVVGWAPVYYLPKTTPSPQPATSQSSNKDAPWKVVLPIPQRTRRGLDLPEIPASTAQMLKSYTRTGACIALVISAIVEVVLYTLEWYHGIY